jgi:putative AlgH/UPF0301 family transcriptional regulator
MADSGRPPVYIGGSASRQRIFVVHDLRCGRDRSIIVNTQCAVMESAAVQLFVWRK